MGDAATPQEASSQQNLYPHELVLSDLHLLCPPGTSRSRYFIDFPNGGHIAGDRVDSDSDLELERQGGHTARDRVDSDGDLELERPRKKRLPYIEIEHTMATALADVGLQVWRGACLLSDLAFQLGLTGQLSGCGNMLELGAGTGLVSVAVAAALAHSGVSSGTDATPGAATGLEAERILSSPGHEGMSSGPDANLGATTSLEPVPAPSVTGHADVPSGPAPKIPKVFCTDAHAPSLAQAKRNLELNRSMLHSMRSPGALSMQALHVFRLMDWMDFDAFDAKNSEPSQLVYALLQPETTVQEANSQEAALACTYQHTNSTNSQEAALASAPECLEASQWRWQQTDVEDLAGIKYIFAADCVYDDVLTEGLLKCATVLLTHASAASHSNGSCSRMSSRRGGHRSRCHKCPKMYVSLEKRYNFTLRDMEERAPAYDFFTSRIHVASVDSQAEDQDAELADGTPEEAHAEADHDHGDDAPAAAATAATAADTAGQLVELVDGTAAVQQTAPKQRAPESANGQAEQANRVTSTERDGQAEEGSGATAASTDRGGQAEQANSVTATRADKDGMPSCVKLLYGRRLEVDALPQVLQYERGDDLELWELSLYPFS